MERNSEVQAILDFVKHHRHSYASLAVCRRAVDSGLGEVTEPVIQLLQRHLAMAPDEEIAAYYTIIT